MPWTGRRPPVTSLDKWHIVAGMDFALSAKAQDYQHRLTEFMTELVLPAEASYHAYREWHGWSVEHSTDRADTRPSLTPTKRQKLLQQWFARNRKQAGARTARPAGGGPVRPEGQSAGRRRAALTPARPSGS